MSEVVVAQGAVVCAEAEIKGDVTIGTGTVVHPKARILAEGGPIVIGENNLIEEQTVIRNRKLSDDEEEVTGGHVMIIGQNNVFEVGSCCEALYVGKNNIMEPKSHVGPRIKISDGCIIGAKCYVNSFEMLETNTVIYGDKCTRRVQSVHPPAQTLQLDFLTKILPNFHHLKKAPKKD
ncbi:dynactin subunit 6-like [Oscarella lobularis]|uniref:dynactin subunit 6-like n=1 Tax=Oscarella lobularis TaxID=121494 RepID=UPI003313BC32